jgi:hypothetical protein
MKMDPVLKKPTKSRRLIIDEPQSELLYGLIPGVEESAAGRNA